MSKSDTLIVGLRLTVTLFFQQISDIRDFIGAHADFLQQVVDKRRLSPIAERRRDDVVGQTSASPRPAFAGRRTAVQVAR